MIGSNGEIANPTSSPGSDDCVGHRAGRGEDVARAKRQEGAVRNGRRSNADREAGADAKSRRPPAGYLR